MVNEHMDYWFDEEVNGYYFFIPRRLLWDALRLSQEIEDFRHDCDQEV